MCYLSDFFCVRILCGFKGGDIWDDLVVLFLVKELIGSFMIFGRC